MHILHLYSDTGLTVWGPRLVILLGRVHDVGQVAWHGCGVLLSSCALASDSVASGKKHVGSSLNQGPFWAPFHKSVVLFWGPKQAA